MLRPVQYRNITQLCGRMIMLSWLLPVLLGGGQEGPPELIMPITKFVMLSLGGNWAVKGVHGEQPSPGNGKDAVTHVSVLFSQCRICPVKRLIQPHFLSFFNSIGGLILDKTVTDPNFEGMAVFTPVINGRLGMGALCMLLFTPPLPPKVSGIHHCPYTEISAQVPAPVMSGSEATGPHHIPA